MKIHFCGSEGINWALDHDLQHLVTMASEYAEIVPLEEAEIVHSVWWRGMQRYSPRELDGKVVLASIADSPQVLMTSPEHLPLRHRIDYWLCEYKSSLNFMRSINLRAELFPDPIDTNVFFPPNDHEKESFQLKDKLKIPHDRYLIANFHRDSKGDRLHEPKKQKGADLLLEIALELQSRSFPAHWLLAGPRRHFLRHAFDKYQIPYTYLGIKTNEDDANINTLPLEEIATIIRGIDLYLVTSRWEGAPNAVLEAAASKVRILSTEVGQAPDILSSDQIESSACGFGNLIERDWQHGWLKEKLSDAYDKIMSVHALDSIKTRLKRLHVNALSEGQLLHIKPRTKFIFKNVHYTRKLGRCFEKERIIQDLSTFKSNVESGLCQWIDNKEKTALWLDDRDPELTRWIKAIKERSQKIRLMICSSALLLESIQSNLDHAIPSIVLHPYSKQGGFKIRSEKQLAFKQLLYDSESLDRNEIALIIEAAEQHRLIANEIKVNEKPGESDGIILGNTISGRVASFAFNALESRNPILAFHKSVISEWGMIGVMSYKNSVGSEEIKSFIKGGFAARNLIWLLTENDWEEELLKVAKYLSHGYHK